MFKGRISGMIVEECWVSGTTVEERFAADSSVPESGLGLMGIWFIEPAFDGGLYRPNRALYLCFFRDAYFLLALSNKGL